MLSRSPLVSSVVVALISGGATLLACSSSSSSGGDTIEDSGSPDGGGSDVTTSTTLAVTPATANVLTCDTLQFKETGGAGNGAWTVSPSGSIDAKSGLFTAPNTSPASPASTITYTEAPASATASVQIATAFLGAPATVPDTTNMGGIGTSYPFEHAFTANGTRVYTAVLGATASGPVVTADIYASNDSGKTFTKTATYHTGNLTCVTAAVDAANPDIVYLVYYAGHGDSTSNTGTTVRLVVSKDGGKTFPTEYIVMDSANIQGSFICPDVTSPSADHVIVAANAFGNNNSEVTTFVSDSDGANIGPVGTEGVAAAANPAAPGSIVAASDTNSAAVIDGCSLEDNGQNESPRIFSNQSGTACITYWSNFGSCNPADGGTGSSWLIQCSTNNGTTWTAPKVLASPNTGDQVNYFSGAISKGGNIAVTYLDNVAGANEVMIAISKDGGKTFSAPIQYPSASRAAIVAGSGTSSPVLAWESDTILWLSQTLNASDAPVLVEDKTCDFGTTWSGAVNAGAYEGTSLLSTSTGMVATGWVRGQTSTVTIPLSGN